MEFELKFWNLIALGAIFILGWFVKRLIDGLDKRLDNIENKQDRIIDRQENQDKQILAHSIILRKNFPDFIVTYLE